MQQLAACLQYEHDFQRASKLNHPPLRRLSGCSAHLSTSVTAIINDSVHVEKGKDIKAQELNEDTLGSRSVEMRPTIAVMRPVVLVHK
ncbi:hypothetical protein DPX16_5138 [Anabarilius grahami]|uniref:Uncharacterized protein n=1 Tax=Anabarilius grahami TaxID=495550 RepID=A0A3N0XL22_ANAGA|nr:hypothetical protein DPX16_5138 [Anabarilius grahami]